MLRRHLKRRTWAHGNSDRIMTILPVGECDGRSEGFCPSFFAASAVTWLLVWFGRSVLLCHDGSCMVLSSYRHEVLSCVLHLASYFHCCFQNRLTEMPAECRGREGSCAKSQFIREGLRCRVQYLLFCQDMKVKTSLPISVLLNGSGSIWSYGCQ